MIKRDIKICKDTEIAQTFTFYLAKTTSTSEEFASLVKHYHLSSK
jgi:hypothetical protein